MIKKILSLKISGKELKFIDSPIGSIIIDCEGSPRRCHDMITKLRTVIARAAVVVIYNNMSSIEDGIGDSDKVTFFEMSYLWGEKDSVTPVPVSIRASLLETKTFTRLITLAMQVGSSPEIYLDAFFCQSTEPDKLPTLSLIEDLANFVIAAVISLENSPTSVAIMKFFRSILPERSSLFKTVDFHDTKCKEFLKVVSGHYICLKGFMGEKETYEEDQKILSLLESRNMILISSNMPATSLEKSRYVNNVVEGLKNIW